MKSIGFISTETSLVLADLSDCQSVKEVSIGIFAELASPFFSQSQRGVVEFAAELVHVANSSRIFFEFFSHGTIAAVLVSRLVRGSTNAPVLLVDHVYLAPGLGAFYLRSFLRRVCVDQAEIIYTRLQSGHAVTKMFRTRKYDSRMSIERRLKLKTLNTLAIVAKMKAFRAVGAALLALSTDDRVEATFDSTPFLAAFRCIATAVSLGQICIFRDPQGMPLGFKIWRLSGSYSAGNVSLHELAFTPSAWREGECLTEVMVVSAKRPIIVTSDTRRDDQ